MKIQEKLKLDRKGLEAEGPITIVAFGDSVTHGALREDVIDYESVYHNRLKKKLNRVRDYTPVNVINAGIGGISAHDSLGRIEKQVLCHNPDLVIVCFGLNDVNGPLEEYLDALKIIFGTCKQSGTEVIFMTPNMLNTYVAEDTEPQHLEYAAKTAEMQNNGTMDLYMEKAVALANKMQVTVCDCYAAWKKRSETEDTTKLLINRINHPTREMHELFADMLFETIMGDSVVEQAGESTMY